MPTFFALEEFFDFWKKAAGKCFNLMLRYASAVIIGFLFWHYLPPIIDDFMVFVEAAKVVVPTVIFSFRIVVLSTPLTKREISGVLWGCISGYQGK
jgi:hypothetical protein